MNLRNVALLIFLIEFSFQSETSFLSSSIDDNKKKEEKEQNNNINNNTNNEAFNFFVFLFIISNYILYFFNFYCSTMHICMHYIKS